MNSVDRINQAIEGWFDNLRGGGTAAPNSGLQPKDVLRKILAAMEDNRVEGLDNKHYVPNQYEVELQLDDPDERGRLLPFLGQEELSAAIERYCQQHQYTMRGPLEIAIREAITGPDANLAATTPAGANAPGTRPQPEKIWVHCRYDIPPGDTVNTRVDPDLAHGSASRGVNEEIREETPARSQWNTRQQV